MIRLEIDTSIRFKQAGKLEPGDLVLLGLNPSADVVKTKAVDRINPQTVRALVDNGNYEFHQIFRSTDLVTILRQKPLFPGVRIDG